MVAVVRMDFLKFGCQLAPLLQLGLGLMEEEKEVSLTGCWVLLVEEQTGFGLLGFQMVEVWPSCLLEGL